MVGMLLAVLLVVFPLAAPPARAALAPGGTFYDDDGNTHEGMIEAIAAEAITLGCDSAGELYCPPRPVTRAQMASFLARAFDLPPASEDFFPDDDGTHEANINRLAGAGITLGFGDGTFRPEEAVTRAQMASFLGRALGLDPMAGDRFDDVSGTHAGSINAIAEAGITLGCDPQGISYCPTEAVRRDQMASFLGRALELTPIWPPPRRAPLNGLFTSDARDLERRVVAVKIDNHTDARPQSGIEDADAVMELVVEGGLTRLVALFHQTDVGYLGPVRSGRPTDAAVLDPLGATFVVSGAQQWILDLIGAAGIPLLTEASAADGLFRITSRTAPHNLYADTVTLREVATGRGHPDLPPPPSFDWGALPGGGDEAGRVVMDWSESTAVLWYWDGERYLRSQDGVAHSWITRNGRTGRMAADTLVVLFGEPYLASPPPGSDGSSVPAVETVGSGPVLVFSGGRVVEGTWERPDTEHGFELLTETGEPLTVPGGIPWISIFPDDRSVTWEAG